MVGVSNTLQLKLRVQKIRLQTILIPVPKKVNEAHNFFRWFNNNIGQSNTYDPINGFPYDGKWYAYSKYFSGGTHYYKVWVKNPDDRTLIKLMWG